jgi:hypothetical protein
MEVEFFFAKGRLQARSMFGEGAFQLGRSGGWARKQSEVGSRDADPSSQRE